MSRESKIKLINRLLSPEGSHESETIIHCEQVLEWPVMPEDCESMRAQGVKPGPDTWVLSGPGYRWGLYEKGRSDYKDPEFRTTEQMKQIEENEPHIKYVRIVRWGPSFRQLTKEA